MYVYVPISSAFSETMYRYLIEGPQGSVLHTGDFRVEPWFLDSLAKEPTLQKYLAVSCPYNGGEPSVISSLTETLEAIYLDTACLLNTAELPSKVGGCHTFLLLHTHVVIQV